MTVNRMRTVMAPGRGRDIRSGTVATTAAVATIPAGISDPHRLIQCQRRTMVHCRARAPNAGLSPWRRAGSRKLVT